MVPTSKSHQLGPMFESRVRLFSSCLKRQVHWWALQGSEQPVPFQTERSTCPHLPRASV